MRGRFFRTQFNVTKLLTATLLCAIAGATAQPPPSPAQDLARLFQLDLPNADTAVLLDASLSMRAHGYAEVRQAVIDFTRTLTNRETLHLRVFGDVPGAPLEGPAGDASSAVAGHLPPAPLFQNTDLGLAIEKALEFLERDGAGDVQILFLLTDGRHQPPGNSPYQGAPDDSPSWQALRKRAQALCARRKVMVYGFGLGAQTDVSLLLDLFPARNVEVVAGDARQVAVTLARARESLRTAQIRQAIDADARAGALEIQFAEAPATDGFSRTVLIRNRYRRLPVVLESLGWQFDDDAKAKFVCDLPAPPRDLTIAPGQQWTGNLRASLRVAPSNLRLGRSEELHRGQIRPLPAARFQHQAEIESLGLDHVAPACKAPPLTIELRVRRGVPYWIPAVALFLIGCALWVLQHGRKMRARHQAAVAERQAARLRLTGELRLWAAQEPEPDDAGYELSAFQTQRLALRPDERGALELVPAPSPPPDAVACLSSHLIGAAADRAESGRVEFRLEASPGHQLAYEIWGDRGAEWRTTSRLPLCDRDLIEVDGRWRLRFANHRLRTRTEVESARNE